MLRRLQVCCFDVVFNGRSRSESMRGVMRVILAVRCMFIGLP